MTRALEAELLRPTVSLVAAGELRPGQIIQWPSWAPGGRIHRPAGSATVRGVRPSGWAAGDWTRVELCGREEWLECSARHRVEVVRVD